MIEDDRIKNKDDLKKILPGIPVFIMPADANALTDYLIELRKNGITPEAVDEVMKKYGDGTAQGEE